MKKWEVKRTIEFIWHVEAENRKEAIEIAEDIGDSAAHLIGYKGTTARTIKEE